MKAAAAPGIDLARRLEDAVAIAVKGEEKAGFGAWRGAVQAGESRLVDLEGDFARCIVPPEADAMVAGS